MFKKLYHWFEKILGFVTIIGTAISTTVCPLWFPVCIPLYGYIFFAFLLGLGLSAESAFVVSAVVGLFLFYVSVKLMYRMYFKIRGWFRRKYPL